MAPATGSAGRQWQAYSLRDPAVTLTWLGRLLEKGERNSRCYDFTEARPVWTKWWFRTCAALVCVCLVWFFWPGIWYDPVKDDKKTAVHASGHNPVNNSHSPGASLYIQSSIPEYSSGSPFL